MKTRGCRIMALLTNDKHIWVELLNITKSLAQLNWDRKMLLFSRDLLASCALPFHSSFFFNLALPVKFDKIFKTMSL